MKQIIIFLAGVVVGMAIVKFMDSRPRPHAGKLSENQEKGLIERQAREKEENKQRILGILETQSPLTNNHIERLLGISDATATRYLEELEKEGRVRQVGRTGHAVYYEKTH